MPRLLVVSLATMAVLVAAAPVIVMSAIDNLLKGQSGQAVQCMNLMMGWDETMGLPQLAFYP